MKIDEIKNMNKEELLSMTKEALIEIISKFKSENSRQKTIILMRDGDINKLEERLERCEEIEKDFQKVLNRELAFYTKKQNDKVIKIMERVTRILVMENEKI